MLKNSISILGALLLSLTMYAQPVNCIDCSLIDPNAICPAIYAPVCGCDGITYSNDCVAINQAGVTFYTDGECQSNNVSACSDLEGVDFGPCEAIIGYSVVNGECIAISGCSTVDSNGIDHAAALFPDPESCEQSCLCGGTSGIEDEELLNASIRFSSQDGGIVVSHSFNEKVQLQIIDMSGRIIHSSTVNDGDLVDVSDLKNGSYLGTLTLDSKVVMTEQLIISK